MILEDEDYIEVSDNEDIDVALKVIHDKEISDEDDNPFKMASLSTWDFFESIFT